MESLDKLKLMTVIKILVTFLLLIHFHVIFTYIILILLVFLDIFDWYVYSGKFWYVFSNKIEEENFKTYQYYDKIGDIFILFVVYIFFLLYIPIFSIIATIFFVFRLIGFIFYFYKKDDGIFVYFPSPLNILFLGYLVLPLFLGAYYYDPLIFLSIVIISTFFSIIIELDIHYLRKYLLKKAKLSKLDPNKPLWRKNRLEIALFYITFLLCASFLMYFLFIISNYMTLI